MFRTGGSETRLKSMTYEPLQINDLALQRLQGFSFGAGSV